MPLRRLLAATFGIRGVPFTVGDILVYIYTSFWSGYSWQWIGNRRHSTNEATGKATFASRPSLRCGPAA